MSQREVARFLGVDQYRARKLLASSSIEAHELPGYSYRFYRESDIVRLKAEFDQKVAEIEKGEK